MSTPHLHRRPHAPAGRVRALPRRLPRGVLARRVLRDGAALAALAATVLGLYGHADRPTPARRATSAAVAGRVPPGRVPPTGQPTGPRRGVLAGQPTGPRRGTPTAERAGARPQGPARPVGFTRADQAAVAAYAARLRLPASRVQALQQRRQDAAGVQVLVAAEAGGRLRTAWLPVTRSRAGWVAR